MVVETICIGTEILLGNRHHTNANYLAQEYAKLGLSTYAQSVVGDNEERIMEALRLALSRSDLVVLNGGLGPTQDDITKETVAKLLGREMHSDEVTKKHIEEYFKTRGQVMAECNLRQTMIPAEARILDNELGTAPGILLNLSEEESARFRKTTGEIQTIILLPGPPEELQEMWQKRVVPYLQKRSGEFIYSATVKVCGRTESEIAEILDDVIRQNGEVTVAPYARTGEVHLRVTAKAADEKTAKKLVKPVVKEIKTRLGDSVYTTDEDVTLEKAVVDLLLANELTVTTVESCTGGLIAGRLINVQGVSEVYKSGFVTYSNKAKRKLVGVKRKTLDKYGAVSEQTVREMVGGATLFNRADVAVAVSGIAGPDGGTEEKPVGLVYIAVSVCGVVTVKEYHFIGNRAMIRERAVAAALDQMRRCILEYYSKLTFGKEE